jgi:hypothetical protein
MHRFIPAVAAATSGARIAEIPVRHHARRFGKSKYGLSRVAKVLGDLLVIAMIRSFSDRPLRLFAAGALGALLLGLGSAAASAIALLFFQPIKATALVLPSVALAWFGLAYYLVVLGLIGETALRRYGRGRTRAPLIVREEAP